MSEKALRKYLGTLLGGHLSQIESHATANGVPDTNHHAGGRDNWLELKWTHGKKKFKLRPSQMTWFRRRGRAGARNLWVLWRHEIDGQISHGIIHAVEPRLTAIFSDTSPSFWRYVSVQTWGPCIDENELNTLLRLGEK